MVGERQSAPLSRNACTASAGFMCMVAHEPARLIGADRQDREPERTVPIPGVAEMLSVAIA